MISGLPPFYSENTSVMYQSILSVRQLRSSYHTHLLTFLMQDPLRFGEEVSPEARSILSGLLTRDPAQRLGANGADEIKRHPFFARHIDWRKLLAKKIQPPFKPSVESSTDTSNVRSSLSSSLYTRADMPPQFDAEFTSEPPMDSVVEDSHLSKTAQDQFEGFTWRAPNAMGESVAPSSHLH